MDRAHHIRDVSSIVCSSKGDKNLLKSALIRYAISQNYCFCGDLLHEDQKQLYTYEILQNVILQLGEMFPRTFRPSLSNILYDFYTSEPQVEVLNNSWFYKYSSYQTLYELGDALDNQLNKNCASQIFLTTAQSLLN